MKLPIYRHPGIREARMEALYRRLKIIGVVNGAGGDIGQYNFGMYPHFTAPATVTASATSDTDGTATTITTTGGGLANTDFLLTHIVYSATASADWRGRLKVNVGGSTRRQICVGSNYSGGVQWPVVQPIFPLRIPRGTSIDLVMASDDGAATRSIDAYIVGLGDHTLPHLSGLRTMNVAANANLPSSAQTTATAGAGAWDLSASTASLGTFPSSASLITAITVAPGNSGVNGAARLVLNSSLFSYFPHTKLSSTTQGSGVRYDLSKYPIFVGPSTTVGVTYYASTGSSTCIVTVEYIPL